MLETLLSQCRPVFRYARGQVSGIAAFQGDVLDYADGVAQSWALARTCTRKTNDKSYGGRQTYQGLKSLFEIFHSERDVWVGEGGIGIIGSLVIQVQLGLCCGGVHSFADLQKRQSEKTLIRCFVSKNKT